jgi:hypothetical protein
VTYINENTYDLFLVRLDNFKTFKFKISELIKELPERHSHPEAVFVIDSLSSIISFLDCPETFYKIDVNGKLETVLKYVDSRKSKTYSLSYFRKLIPLRIDRTSNKIILTCEFTNDFPGVQNWLSDPDCRLKMFSGGLVAMAELTDSSFTITKELGKYPYCYTNPQSSFYYYISDYCITQNSDILNSFGPLDSISVTTKENKIKYFHLRTFIDRKISIFNKDSIMNYGYINRYSYETSSYHYIFSDFYRPYSYVIGTIPDKYVNPDGTLNDPSEAPWSLIVLDSNYSTLGEFQFVKGTFSKHYSLVTEKGIGILDKTLTKRNKHKYLTYVIYKLLNKKGL